MEYAEITFHLTVAVFMLAAVFYMVLEYHTDKKFPWFIIIITVFAFLTALSVTRALKVFAEILVGVS